MTIELHAGRGEVAGELGGGIEVDAAVVVEQRHEGDAHTGEHGIGHAATLRGPYGRCPCCSSMATT